MKPYENRDLIFDLILKIIDELDINSRYRSKILGYGYDGYVDYDSAEAVSNQLMAEWTAGNDMLKACQRARDVLAPVPPVQLFGKIEIAPLTAEEKALVIKAYDIYGNLPDKLYHKEVNQ